MSAQPPVTRPAAPAPGRVDRVEYLDFHDVDHHRTYEFRVYGPGGSREFRLRIASTAFGTGRVRMQDGPDVCYQKLLRTIAAVEIPAPDLITIDDTDLLSYRDEHTPVVRKRRSSWTPSPADAPAAEPRKRPPFRTRTPARPEPVAAPVASESGPSLGEGQRVDHALFGVGVTVESTRARTVVRFDRDGLRTFVTSMLEVEVLSAPHTWETSPRGANRPCRVPPPSSRS